MAGLERGARAAARRARSVALRARGPGRGPRVSVVVAVRDDGAFLATCVDSVLASTHRAVEVLVAADPAVPGAVAAVAALPRARRVRVVAPAGDGSWLDAAVAAARGRYLCFADAGDVVPAHAHTRMVALLEQTGSDLVVGVQRQGQAGRPGVLPPEDGLFTGRRLRETLDSCPEALVDLALTNKMFRLPGRGAGALTLRSWDSGPATVAAAYLAAGSFDVIPGTVYEQHARDASLPVDEQRRFSPSVAAARLEALREVAALAAGHGHRLRDVWLAGALTRLLPPMYVDAVGGGPAYLAELAPTVRGFWEQGSEAVAAQVPLAERLAGWAAAYAGLEDLALVEDHLADNPDGLPVERPAGGEPLALPPDGLGVVPPAWARRVEPVDRRLNARAADLVRDGDRLRLDGAAFLDYCSGADLPDLVLCCDEGERERRLRLDPERRVDPALDLWAARSWEDRSGSGFRAWIDPAELPGPEDAGFRVEVTLSGQTRALPVRGPAAPRSEQETFPADVVLLDEVELAGDVLRVAGEAAGTLTGLQVSGARGATATVPVRRDGDRFDAEVPLRTTLFAADVHLPTGRFRVEPLNAEGRTVPARWAAGLLGDPPALVGSRAGVVVVDEDGPATLEVGVPLSAHDRSAFGQRQLQTRVYAGHPTPAYDRTVLLETFRGRSVGDNPGAIGRELAARDLGLDLAWVVDDPSVQAPAGTRAVARRTREWYDLLGGARAHVSNAGAPYWFVKRPGQVHLQTWHGTPLKRIGEDRGPGDFWTWRHRRRIAAQAARWDALLSPSPFCSPIFRSAFRFDGRLLEVGYPRNDLLVSPEAPAVRARVRAALGLADADRVVLYAPTWREYIGVRDTKPLYLDAEELTRRLPDTVVLVRGHYNATGQRDVFEDHPRIHDVTRYPDIADLYLAADVLVTDYSSVMFDFALTDKPVALLVPDLVQYRDVERGFYFDIERRAPGPLLTSTAEVVDVLQGPDAHAGAREAFRAEFCPWDDGRASARVVDWLLPRL